MDTHIGDLQPAIVGMTIRSFLVLPYDYLEPSQTKKLR
jgi:hypothetical protein